jgi:proteasome activator subunit 4
LCTTAFLAEVSQYIKINDLTAFDEPGPALALLATDPTLPVEKPFSLPSFSLNLDGSPDMEPHLTRDEEDALLKVRKFR